MVTELSVEEGLSMFYKLATLQGYRPPTKEDFVSGAEMLQIEVDYLWGKALDLSSVGVKIKLNEEPLRTIMLCGGKIEYVYYHPVSDENRQCYVPTDKFLATEWVSVVKTIWDTCTRYLVKQ